MKNKMNKIYLLIAVLCIFTLAGCGELNENMKPSNEYLEESKKKIWLDIGLKYINLVNNEIVEGRKFLLFSTDTLYMIPVGNDNEKTCIPIESGGQSPFSDNWNYAYVGVIYNNTVGKYTYYYVVEDSNGYGINLMTRKEIDDYGIKLIYSNSNRENKDFGDYLIQTYDIIVNEKHNITTLENDAYKKILNTNSNITKIV